MGVPYYLLTTNTIIEMTNPIIELLPLLTIAVKSGKLLGVFFFLFSPSLYKAGVTGVGATAPESCERPTWA